MNYLLIGKPNVGKSSIYNILTSSDSKIVHSESGTTRDWHYDKIRSSSQSYIFDTPGILISDKLNRKNIIQSFLTTLEKKIDKFLYVIDYTNLFNYIDDNAIDKLRKFEKEIILLCNKFDNFKETPNNDILKYGIRNYFFLSCSHKFGFQKLESYIYAQKDNKDKLLNTNIDFSFAIFGKPNSGKSTLLNSFLGYERSSTSPIPNTTSDYVEDTFIYQNKTFKIIDTAGIGKKANIVKKSVNFYSIKKSFENISKVDSALIIIDSKEGLDRQDKRIINMIADKAKSVLIIFNKIDLIEQKNKFKNEVLENISFQLSQVKNIKVFFLSAFSKVQTNNLLKYMYANTFNKYYIITTSKLNDWLKFATKKNLHPLIENKNVNFKYATQIKQKPVTIKIFCNFASKINNSYQRYLINDFNQNFNIINQKTKIIFSSSKNPFI